MIKRLLLPVTVAVIIILASLVGVGYMAQKTVSTGSIATESGDGVDYAARKPVGQVAVGPTYTLTDLGELAARIAFGVPNSFDRRGNVIWADDFEDNAAKWYASTTGAGGSFALSTEAARSGAKSGKLICGSTVGDSNSINRDLPYPVIGKVGIEAHLSLGANIRSVELQVLLWDGSNYHAAALAYYPQDDTVNVYVLGGTYKEIATGVTLREFVSAFHAAKLVIDLSTGKYVRVLLNEESYDVEDLSYQQSSSALTPAFRVGVVARPNDGSNRHVYIDDFIATQNEPEND